MADGSHPAASQTISKPATAGTGSRRASWTYRSLTALLWAQLAALVVALAGIAVGPNANLLAALLAVGAYWTWAGRHLWLHGAGHRSPSA
jgi:hypothetical protein